MTQDPHTPERASGKPLSAPQGDETPVSGIRGGSEGEFGAQADAQSLASRAQIQPPAHNAGPTVAECAEADRRWWSGEKTGEQ